MKPIVVVVALSFFLTGCAIFSPSSGVREDPPSELKELTDIYKKRDEAGFTEFIKTWSETYKPIPTSSLRQLPEVVRSSYEIFQLFYSPFNIKRIGGSEWGDKINEGSKCVVVQDTLNIRIVKSLANYNMTDCPEDLCALQIAKFRPRLALKSKTVLRLTDKYERTLNSFLGTDHTPLGMGNIMSPAQSSGESERRSDFLRKQFLVIQGHWGGYWELLTQPQVEYIVFNPELTEAIVHFQIVYEGGEATFKRAGGQWKMVKAVRTWIQ